MKNSSRLLTTLLVAPLFIVGLAFAQADKNTSASKVAGCCDKAAKNGNACTHGCCVEAAKAGNNCTKCGGSGKIEKKTEAKK